MVQTVELFQVGNRAAAGTAPRCPELQQRVVALAQILRQLVVASVGVHQRHVGKRGSLGGTLNHVGMCQHGLSLSGGLHLVADGGHKALDGGVVESAERLVECHHTSQVVAVAHDEILQEGASCGLGRVLACQFFHHVVHRCHAVLIVVLLVESVAHAASALGIVGASLFVLAVQVVQGRAADLRVLIVVGVVNSRQEVLLPVVHIGLDVHFLVAHQQRQHGAHGNAAVLLVAPVVVGEILQQQQAGLGELSLKHKLSVADDGRVDSLRTILYLLVGSALAQIDGFALYVARQAARNLVAFGHSRCR